MNIVLIGAGNVGQQLALALKKAGHRIVQVHGKGMHRARSLARELGSNHLKDIRELDTSADIILLAVPDDAIPAILKSIPATKQLIVHTAGNVPLSVFGRKFPNAGVFYPLQSFSADRPLRMRHIPILIEARTPQLRRKLNLLGKSISEEVVAVSSEQRQWLHLAAVISNNFTNHLLYLSSSLLQRHRLPFRLLYPLIRETTEKAIALHPLAAQTGPARRGDRKTMQKHLSLLASDPRLRSLYRLMSNGIAAVKR